MRFLVVLAFLVLSANARACLTAFDLAQLVSSESQIPSFIESTPFGGRWYRVEDSSFVVIELQTRSGPYLSDLYVFSDREAKLGLRLALSGRPEAEKKVEVDNGVLSVYERARDEEEWNLVIRLVD